MDKVDWEGLKAKYDAWLMSDADPGAGCSSNEDFWIAGYMAAHEKDQAELLRLRERLEMWATDDAGNRFYMPDENTDGISCRDETIKLLDERHERDQRMIKAAENLRDDALTLANAANAACRVLSGKAGAICDVGNLDAAINRFTLSVGGYDKAKQ